jgi:hypothetical protein
MFPTDMAIVNCNSLSAYMYRVLKWTQSSSMLNVSSRSSSFTVGHYFIVRIKAEEAKHIHILKCIHSTNNREFVTHQSTMKITITTLFVLILACTTNVDGRKLKTGGRGGMTKNNDKKGTKGSSSSKKGGKRVGEW